MINRYQKISIIYGTGGRECALCIHRLLKDLHEQEGMPVESHLLAEELLSSADIVNRVRDIISSSSRCIILLTFDDQDGKRVRQNVLVEIGMALVLIGREKCYVVSEKKFLPDDFPSDIKGALNPNYMEIRNAEESAEKITRTIIKEMRLKTHLGILDDQKYIYDYMKVLDDIPGPVFEEKPDLQMAHILDTWIDHVLLFTYTEERICYILERVVFFPIFPGNNKMKHFLLRMKEAIRTEVRDFEEEETEDLIAGRALVMRILEYVELRQIHDRAIGDNMLLYEYERIAEELEDIIDRLDQGEIRLNWYLKVAALDYAALSRMHMLNMVPESETDSSILQEKVIAPLNRVEEIIRKNCRRAGELWNGYVYYNLSRAYEKMYRLEQKEDAAGTAYSDQQAEDAFKKIKEYSLRSISIRRRWIENGMKGIFSTALSYEYFLAVKYEYELCESLPGYSEKTPERMTEDIRRTLAELSVYCKTTGLEKLFTIRDSFEKMIVRLK